MSAARRLELRPSYALAAAIVGAHAAAGLSLGLLFANAPGALLGACVLALGAAAAWSRALLRGPAAVRALELGAGQVLVQLGSGAQATAAVAPRRYVSRFLVTLRLGAPLGRTLLVTAGMLEPRQFRLLRIWALWGKLPGVAAEQLAS